MRKILPLASDSYKLTHWPMYPPGTEYLHSYFESRGSEGPCGIAMDWVCFFGLQPIMIKHLEGCVVTEDDVRYADEFCKEHFGRPGLFNLEGWLHIARHHQGHLPVSIRAVPEGTVVNNRNVMMTVVNTCKRSAWLVNFLESLLVQVWYPTTVATMSREIKKLIMDSMVRTVGHTEGIGFKLHDFGFRGVSSMESSGLGGAAHLVNFDGTDTVHGIRYAQEYYDAQMPGFSIPATEHSIMTARGEDGEDLVLDQVLDAFPEGLVATVGDSYDMFEYIETILAARKERILARNGTLVVRPDSGDPVTMVSECLTRLEKVFGSTLNEQGYKVLPPQVRLIQGDGIGYAEVRQILEVMVLGRWSTENIAFGMGGALLQKLNRDTLKFAFKASEITIDGVPHPVFKNPKTDPGKASKQGRMKLVQVFGPDGMSYETRGLDEPGEDVLVEVFRDGEILKNYSFDEVRKRASDSIDI
jgi:nicotinamide phosphoribosyltransferase